MITPIYHKTGPELEWPEGQKAFYLVTRDGLFLCRDHMFFRSCVRAPAYPAELAGQTPFLRLNYPRVPRGLFERILGFLAIVGEQHGAEAAVLLAWNLAERRYEVIVPEQQSVVGGRLTGRPYPIEVHYQIPHLPEGWFLVGDVHSHVNEAAYASPTDQADEQHRPGLHIVVGRLCQEPPEFHIEMTVDGSRFSIQQSSTVLEGYVRRRTSEVPPDWLRQVAVFSWSEYHERFGRRTPPSAGGSQETAPPGTAHHERPYL